MDPACAPLVGEDRDTLKRQRAAVEGYAAEQGIEIVGEEYDAAVSGADPLEAREGFVALLARIAGNGVRTILVETANRFARDLIVQETGWNAARQVFQAAFPFGARGGSGGRPSREIRSISSGGIASPRP